MPPTVTPDTARMTTSSRAAASADSAPAEPVGTGRRASSRPPKERKVSGSSPRQIGPYALDSRLAAGGMAEVYVAHRKGPHGFTKRVALKRILPQYGREPDFQAMFIDEANIAAQLSHPNVVQVFDFGERDGDLYLAMELVEGTNVNRVLRAAAFKGVEIPLDLALYIAGETARGLAYAHAARGIDGSLLGVVHRDVSPANVLLTNTGHVKLADFGIATAAIRSRHTETGHVRGKLGYMSPEQVLGRPVDGRSDVFTLATVLAELLIQKPLFGTGPDLDILVRIRDVDLGILKRAERQIPQDVRGLLERTLVRDRDARPSAAVFADACDEVRRRRAMGHAPERLARFLRSINLVDALGEDEAVAGGADTSFFDPEKVAREAAELVPAVGAVSPDIYRVQFPDGKVLGPMSFPRLVQMLTSGEIRRETLVSKEGLEFAPATILPELTRFVTSPALQWRLEELTRSRKRGDLGPGVMLRVVYELMRDRATGVLHLWQDNRRKKVYFVDGHPEFVASTDRSELIGEYLVTQGHLLRMEVEMALALLPRYGGRLGDALVGLGLMRPVELFRAITTQVRERLLEAFEWRIGHWAWVPELRSHEETFPLPEDGFELLRDAVARIHPEELESLLAPNWERIIYPRSRPPVPVEQFELPATWLKVLTRLEGGATIAAHLARQAASGADGLIDAYRALHLAVACDFMCFDEPDCP